MAEEDDTAATCEPCNETLRPWSAGRSALRYTGLAKKLVLGLKHYDRHDFAPGAAQWMARAAEPLLHGDTILAPVPLHWSRLVKRRYNQAAMLTFSLGQRVLRPAVLDLLIRTERSEHMPCNDADVRLAAMRKAIAPNPKRLERMAGARVLLIDDVMISGATLTACAEACLTAGARDVKTLTLARAAKDT